MPGIRSLRRTTLVLASALAAAGLIPSDEAFALSARKTLGIPGSGTNEFFGQVAASLDFNGDGHRDFVASAWNSSGGAGRIAIYLGPGFEGAPLTFAGAAGQNLGYSVASAGDVNRDGYEDLVVGAPGSGSVYVLLGGASPNAVVDFGFLEGSLGDYFGFSVSGAGDVNADGFDDIIVGAPYNTAGGSFAGRAYIYFGGASPNTVVDVTITGAPDDFLGTSVASAGDFDGDGIDDALVGAGTYITTSDPGTAAVYFGSTFYMDGYADRTFTGTAVNDHFGNSVAGVGDMNADGYDDILIGAHQDSPNAGYASVFLGGPASDAAPDLTVTGAEAGVAMGTRVKAAGDINGDGFADAAICAAWGGAAYKGAVYFMLGGDYLAPTPGLILAGGPLSQLFGVAIAAMGDLDGDGYGDVLLGAPDDASITGTSVGAVYLYSVFPYQVLSPNGGELWVAGQPATVRWRGHDVADLALSSDGGATWTTIASSVGGSDSNAVEIIVPDAPSANCRVRLTYRNVPANLSNSDASDAVFRIVSPASPVASHLESTPTGAAASDNFAFSVAGAGDVNGDGFDDIVVGANANDAGGSNAGRAYVYYGGATDATADLTFTGAAVNDGLGTSVSGAGDFNGDGYGDLIAGAPAANGTGRAYLFYGGPGADAIADLTLDGAAAADNFGLSVSGAGDVNGDGFADVIVGAYRNDTPGTDAGRAYVFYGGTAPNAVADLTLSGEFASDFFGYAVSKAGDVNGDGFSDVIVCAYRNDQLGADTGRAYVFFGGASPNATADLTLTGATAGDFFGYSVSGAGDVNGDGYADVIAGAYNNDAAGPNFGRAYVFFGGPGADAAADMVLSGAATGDLFGVSVRGAGDVNADGFDDVVVGSFNDAGGADAGRAYVYLGGSIPDEVADFTFNGASPGDAFSSPVAGAGDVTGDGFDDLIIGATSNDAGGTNAGRAYLYDFGRYFVTAPNGGETWNVGATQTVSWLGAEPADLWLSTDGGGTFELLDSNLGGEASNSVAIRVPHLPSRFSRVRVTPHDSQVTGADASDSSFTIQTSVSLLLLVAESDPEGGTTVSWSSEPGVGPEGLAGYRLYRLAHDESGNGTRVGPELIAETRYRDALGSPGAIYRLTAINGLAEELELGRVRVAVAASGLRAWPSPLSAGAVLNVEFPVPFAAPGFPATDLDVGVFDLAGRRVATLARGLQTGTGGVVTMSWAPSSAGRAAGSGVYFVRVTAPSVGFRAERKIAIVQ